MAELEKLCKEKIVDLKKNNIKNGITKSTFKH